VKRVDKRSASGGVGASLTSSIAGSALGGVLGGSAAALLVVAVTEMIKAMLAVVSRQEFRGQHGPDAIGTAALSFSW
jgi:hypothetical protein